jgi:tetratricopeptide (TPR) repeat protein
MAARITRWATIVFATWFAVAFAADDAAAIAARALALLDRGDALAASHILEPAVEKNPKSAELHYLLAKSYSLEAKDSHNAIRLLYLGWTIGDQLEAAIALEPARLDARLDLIRYYVLAPRVVGGNLKKAREQAAAIGKRDAALGAFAGGYIDYREKDFGRARLRLREAAALARDDATKILALTWLGYLSQESQQYDDAFAAFDKILTIDAKHFAALYEIGRTALFSGRELDRGEASLRRYLTTTPRVDEPSIALAHLQLGLLLERKGDRVAALREVEVAMKLDSSVDGGQAALNRLK